MNLNRSTGHKNCGLLTLTSQFRFPKSITLSSSEPVTCKFQDQLLRKLATITNGTAAGKFDIVFGGAVVRNTTAVGT